MSGEDSKDLLQDDYYTFLNVDRDASEEEIISSYRRLSRIYHPDKHSDPAKKHQAEELFNKTKKAYEVLSDAHKRAIYDTLGAEGLKTEGWEMVERRRSPNEIREEYERLVKEKEERRLQQRTNPKGTISVAINALDLFDRHQDYEPHFPRLEVSAMTISQSIDAPLNSSNTVSLSGNLASQNGIGSGTIATSLRHIVSAKTWLEVQFAAGQGPLLTFKGFRTLSNRSFFTASTFLHFGGAGIRPGIELGVGRQLSKHLVGYLTWKGGIQRSMNTNIVWDSETNHLMVGFQFGIRNSFASVAYTRKVALNESKIKGVFKFGSSGFHVEYGCETKLSQYSVIGASMVIGVPSGVTLKIRISRSNQSYLFPILLSDEIIPTAIFYGTVTPLLAFLCVRQFVINPYSRREKEKEVNKSREENAAKLLEKKKEAQSVISLMRETCNRIVKQESSRKGLIILKAVFGNSNVIKDLADDEEIPETAEAFDVTIPLQCLVKDSTLTLPAASKSNLPGFYDPCLGDEKQLLVKYRYRDLVHQVISNDMEQLKIPNNAHLGNGGDA